MTLFKYKAISENGDVITGIREANSEEDIILMLKKSNYYPINIELKTEINLFTQRITKRDLSVFCRQFSTMLRSGINLVNSLFILIQQIDNRILKKALLMVYQDVQKGISLSSAMKKHKKVFPELLTSMVEVGETSGNLDILLERMGFYYEKQNNIKNKIKNALLYPTILGITSVLVIIFLFTVVMPTYLEMFGNSQPLLPTSTRLVFIISKWLVNYWYVLIILLAFLLTAIKYYAKTEKGIMFFDYLKINIPIIKKITIKVTSSLFSRTMSLLLSSGIPLLVALDITKKVLGNKVVLNKLEIVKENIRKGKSFSDALRDTGIFPPIVYSMIKVGEESGELDKLLYKIADYFDEEMDYTIQKKAILLEPILIIFMAVIIGFIVISTIMPILDIINNMEI